MLATIITYELVLLQFNETTQSKEVSDTQCIPKYSSDNATTIA